jgi:hypothetical protein
MSCPLANERQLILGNASYRSTGVRINDVSEAISRRRTSVGSYAVKINAFVNKVISIGYYVYWPAYIVDSLVLNMSNLLVATRLQLTLAEPAPLGLLVINLSPIYAQTYSLVKPSARCKERQ